MSPPFRWGASRQRPGPTAPICASASTPICLYHEICLEICHKIQTKETSREYTCPYLLALEPLPCALLLLVSCVHLLELAVTVQVPPRRRVPALLHHWRNAKRGHGAACKRQSRSTSIHPHDETHSRDIERGRRGAVEAGWRKEKETNVPGTVRVRSRGDGRSCVGRWRAGPCTRPPPAAPSGATAAGARTGPAHDTGGEKAWHPWRWDVFYILAISFLFSE